MVGLKISSSACYSICIASGNLPPNQSIFVVGSLTFIVNVVIYVVIFVKQKTSSCLSLSISLTLNHLTHPPPPSAHLQYFRLLNSLPSTLVPGRILCLSASLILNPSNPPQLFLPSLSCILNPTFPKLHPLSTFSHFYQTPLRPQSPTFFRHRSRQESVDWSTLATKKRR